MYAVIASVTLSYYYMHFAPTARGVPP